MSFHISAKPGEIAETVLLPGDPYRARWAAQTYLQDVVQINDVRGMLGFTGRWNGHPVTIQGTGMGMPSMSIYANELIRDYGAKTLIRIGSAGALQEDIQLRDVILAMAASSEGSPSRSIMREVNFAPTADFGLLSAAHRIAATRAGTQVGTRVDTRVGMIHSGDTFYDERPDLLKLLERHGCLAVEMETAELYTLARRHGVRALSVLTISDHMLRDESLPAQDRETGFGAMVEIALGAAFA